MIGYPTKKKTQASKVFNRPLDRSSNARGLSFEEDINQSNTFYREIDRALIYKKPTPVQIVRVDYPMRSRAKIVEAYFKQPSTTDYNGIYKKTAIDFEAKQTALKTMFPLSDIHAHQIEHLRKVLYHGGIGFVLIRFTHYNEIYYIEANKVIQQYDDPAIKSLPYTWIKQEGHLVKQGFQPRVDYLAIVDTLYFKEANACQKNGK